MAKYTYLHKTVRGLFEIDEKLGEEKLKGTTYQDYLNGLWIPLKKKQNEFVRANPAASVKEWIEMELAPASPAPSLEELKEQAVSQVKQAAVSKMTELFPVDEVVANAYFKDESESVAYFLSYSEARDAINSYLEVALKDIVYADDNVDITFALDVFNALINGL